MKPLLSLCMIVKDEESQLPRCLASVEGVVDEVIIVDTGSTDRTVALAEEAGAIVLHHVWDGSFSSARNVSLDAAAGEWVLVLDADEALVDGRRLRDTLAAGVPEPTEGFILPLVNFIGERAHEDAVTSPGMRVFRNRPSYRYSRALHEQIMMAILDHREDAVFGYLDVAIEHYGYLNSLVSGRDKIKRNLEIAEREVQRYPNDAFSWYNLGQEYFRLGDWDKAVYAYQEGFPYLHSLAVGFAPALIKHLVVSLINLHRSDDAVAVLEDAMDAYEVFTDLWILKGLALMQKGEFEAARDTFLEAERKGEVDAAFFMSDEGAGSFKARWWVGQCELNLGRLDDAKASYKAALEELSRRGRFLNHPIDGLLHAFRLQNLDSAAVLAELPRYVELEHPRWRDLTVRALLEAGFAEAALELLGNDLPVEDATCLLVGQTHLRAGRLDKALRLWGAVPADSPQRIDADWNRVLGLAVSGHLARARQVFQDAVVPCGGHDMVELYRGLLALWGDQLAEAVTLRDDPVPVRDHVASVLRLLLSMGALDLFERTLPALDWLGLEDGAQAALVGRLYYEAGLWEPAMQALVLAVEAGETSDAVLRQLGMACLRCGAYAEAEALLKEVVDRQGRKARGGSTDRPTLMAYATALSAQGKQAEAEPLWQRLTIDGSQPAQALPLGA